MLSPGLCLGCGNRLPEPFLDLGSMPLANSFVRPERAHLPESAYPLAVAHCPACHLVQVTRPVPPAELFSEYLYFSSYSETYLAHAREMAGCLCEQLGLGRHSRVLEIASNDGYLLQYFQERGVTALGVEPARNVAAVARARGIPTLERFFGPETVDEILSVFGPADLILGNNVLAHVPAINGFLAAVRACLKPEGVAMFEFPHLKDLIERTEFDTIYHEHVFYLSLTALDPLARRAGLRVLDVRRQPVHGGSLRVLLARSDAASPVGPSVGAILAEEHGARLHDVARYEAFSQAVRSVRQEIPAHLERLKHRGCRLAAYGAPAKGNTLLNACGIGRELLEFTVDRSPHKQGLLLPGSRLPIRSPEDLLLEMPDRTLILPWNIAEEIVAQQAEYQRRGGRFIVPMPSPREIAA